MPNQPPWLPSDAPAETGPDYVALVIEWDDLPEEITQETPHNLPALLKQRLRSIDVLPLVKKVAIGAGALAALLFARWGIQRLRHA